MVTISVMAKSMQNPQLALIMPLQEAICTFPRTRFVASFSVDYSESLPVAALSGKLGSNGVQSVVKATTHN
jgi:hypothetical protein